MNDLKHIHAVKAGVQSLITFIIGSRMQHGIIHQSVIISMQHLPKQEEILFLAVGKAAQPSDKVLIQAICHIQPKSVNIKGIDPVLHCVQDMLHYFIILQVQLHKIIIAFPALIPKSVIIT